MQELIIQFFTLIGFTKTDGTLLNITKSSMQEGEVFLSEMNTLEKTCLMFLQNKKVEYHKLHEQIIGLVGVDSPEDLAKMERKHAIMQDTINAVRSIMWSSIKRRLPREVGSIGMALRNGNKIVARFREEESDDFSCSFLVECE